MITFDIETRANVAALQHLPPVKPNARLKDPAKIEADIEAKELARLEKAALSPHTGVVSTLCIIFDNAPAVHSWQRGGFGEAGEEDVLEAFWKYFTEHNGLCCGYNILGFDLPYILARSMALGVDPGLPVSMLPNLRRYTTTPIRDLMWILAGWEKDKFLGLSTIAKLYNLDHQPVGKGGDVEDMTPEEELEHCQSDVLTVVDLHERMKGLYF